MLFARSRRGLAPALFALTLGCTQAKPVLGPTPEPVSAVTSGPALAAVDQFVRDFTSDKASAKQLTEAYRVRLSRNDPTAAKIAVDAYLAHLSGGAPTESPKTYQVGSTAYVFGAMSYAGAKPEAFRLKLADVSGAWAIDGAYRSTAESPPFTPMNPETIPALAAVYGMLETMLGGDPKQTEQYLTLAYRKKIGWGTTPEAARLGYNSAQVQGELKKWKAKATGFTLTKQELPTPETAQFAGTLNDGRTFDAKLSRDASGWLVEMFEVR